MEVAPGESGNEPGSCQEVARNKQEQRQCSAAQAPPGSRSRAALVLAAADTRTDPGTTVLGNSRPAEMLSPFNKRALVPTRVCRAPVPSPQPGTRHW